MNKRTAFAFASILATTACSKSSEPPTAVPPQPTAPPAVTAPKAPIPPSMVPTNTKPQDGTISIQRMLVTGPPQLKLHSLAMLTQGNFKGEIDESFLPGFKACAEDRSAPIRSVAARIMGEKLVAGREVPNAEAVAILSKLAGDESSDVRFKAVYYGLSQLKQKSDKVISLLIDVATKDREESLYKQIVDSLASDRARVATILDRRLADGDSVAVYEVYEDLAGKKPADHEKYLNMPSSRPRMFIFQGRGEDAEAYKAELASALKAAGIERPELVVSGQGANYVVLLQTYLTKDRLAVEEQFMNHETHTVSQDMWLTPELEIQLQRMSETQ